jgi:hypothetical protein
MTEAEWRDCDDSKPMLEWLDGQGSKRKRHLFACACARRNHWTTREELSRKLVEATERFADGLIGKDELRRAETYDCDECPALEAALGNAEQAAYVTWCLVGDGGTNRRGTRDFWDRARQERAAQARLVRCVFGNPFLPVHFDTLWRTADGVSVAQAAYDTRALPSGELGPVRLAVLADALEEAGCADSGLLGHLHSPGPHVRGCWPLDLVLGKE